MNGDPHALDRFLAAQRDTYDRALSELRDGCKRSHWMWFIFPQLAGLGSSPTARLYAIRDREEAAAYLAHPVLGPRLIECGEALLAIEGKSARDILGDPDDLKLRSSATLFSLVAPSHPVFGNLIDRYFGGLPDPRTVALLRESGG